VVKHLRAGRITSAPFIDQIVPYAEAPSAYARLQDDPNRYFSLIFDWTALD